MPLDFPSSLPVEAIDAKHPAWEDKQPLWSDLDLLYRGGHAIKKKAEHFLHKRPKENVDDVYAARVRRFTYQNIIGTAIGWYLPAMFVEKPEVAVLNNEKPLDISEETGPGEFYGRFFEDADRNGASLNDFFSDVFLDGLLYQRSFILTDLPRVDDQGMPTLAAQRQTGALDPYLVRYDPRSVINWQRDQFGALDWLVIKTVDVGQTFAGKSRKQFRWLVLDRERFGLYTAESKDKEEPKTATLESEGPHTLSKQKRVPIREFVLPEAMWLGDRVYLPLISHLNIENSFEWALFMANLPVPVITGDWEQGPTLSETGLIQLAEGSEFKFSEPEGTSFQHSANRIAALRQEIYRQLYLQAQSRDEQATAAAQSGVSKKQDMAPARDVLNGMAALLKTAMVRTLEDVAEARGDAGITFEITGLIHEEDTTDEELASLQQAQELTVESDTYDREVQKRAARCILSDADAETIATIEKEIDSAPGRGEREEAEREQMRADFRGRMAVEEPQAA